MGFASFNNAKEEDITFLTERDNEKAKNKLMNCKAYMVYIHLSVCSYIINNDILKDIKPILVSCDNPKFEFMKKLETIKPKIYHNNECVSGVMITDDEGLFGAEPLNVERDEQGKLHQFKYQGNIRIGNNVHIGNNVTVARGALGDTVIEDNVMIDSNVFVGNEALIGSGCIVCVGVIIGGGVKIGKDCFIGLGAIVNNHIKIGDSVIVGSGAVVTKDVEDKDIVAGVPAKSIKDKVTLNERERYKMVNY